MFIFFVLPYVNSLQDPYVNSLQDPYVNSLQDPYVNSLQDPYVNLFTRYLCESLYKILM